jgi:hydrogenase-1 operon protein HyaF
MSRLAGIPIRIEPPARVDGLGGGVTAILHEIVTLLERLATAKEPSAIDLRSLPMSPLDRTELKRALGEGEVQATLNAEGVSTIQETRIPGVWWVEHRDPQGQLVAELIDVTYLPEILARVPNEIAAGALALREQMATAGSVAAERGGNGAGRQ